MKPISEKIIKPIEEANEKIGRINRKLVQNIFFIDIDRPTKMNGFTPYMFQQIAEAFTEYENNNNALCAIVYTSGDNFCAGMDLDQMSKLLDKGDHSYINNNKYIDPLGLNKPIRTKPLIVAVKGNTFTYGLELMLSADIALTDESVNFAMLEVKRGLLMTGGATIRFVERAGWSNAMKYLLTGLNFDAKEAYRMNLVQEVLKKEVLFTRAIEIATLICKVSPKAVKSVISNSRVAQHDRYKAIAEFDKIQDSLIKSEDFKEGLKSFKEKREPNFNK